MKVLFQDDDRFMLEVGDGNPQVLIVKYDGTPESLKVFTRNASKESALRFGMWDTPDPQSARYILSQLQGKKFPVSAPNENITNQSTKAKRKET